MTSPKRTSIFSNSSNATEGNLRKTVAGLALWTLCNMLWMLIYALSRVEVGRWYVHNAGTALEVFGYAALLGVAALAVGGLLGFLFGIPRTIQSEDKPTDEFRQNCQHKLGTNFRLVDENPCGRRPYPTK